MPIHDGIYFNDFYRLDLESFEWFKIESNDEELPFPRFEHSMVLSSNDIIVFGGLEGKKVFNDTRIYNLSKEILRGEKV